METLFLKIFTLNEQTPKLMSNWNSNENVFVVVLNLNLKLCRWQDRGTLLHSQGLAPSSLSNYAQQHSLAGIILVCNGYQ